MMRTIQLVVVWTGVLAAGLLAMFRYETTAGEAGSPPTEWPAAADFRRQLERPTLLVFAHPKCPCTRATISELARIMNRFHDRVETYVIFLKPSSESPGWEKSGLWNDANAIRGVNVVTDDSGRLAQLFSVKTSGSTLLYDTKGQRLFQGGITIARGHEGANAGSDSVFAKLAALTESQPLPNFDDLPITPVFGCPLCSRIKSGE